LLRERRDRKKGNEFPAVPLAFPRSRVSLRLRTPLLACSPCLPAPFPPVLHLLLLSPRTILSWSASGAAGRTMERRSSRWCSLTDDLPNVSRIKPHRLELGAKCSPLNLFRRPPSTSRHGRVLNHLPQGPPVTSVTRGGGGARSPTQTPVAPCAAPRRPHSHVLAPTLSLVVYRPDEQNRSVAGAPYPTKPASSQRAKYTHQPGARNPPPFAANAPDGGAPNGRCLTVSDKRQSYARRKTCKTNVVRNVPYHGRLLARAASQADWGIGHQNASSAPNRRAARAGSIDDARERRVPGPRGQHV